MTLTFTRVQKWARAFIMLTSCSQLFGKDTPTAAAAGTASAERQVTAGVKGRVLTNIGVWSPDSQWLVYDTRSDKPGSDFNGETIEMVNVKTGEVREVYRATQGAHCGVVTCHPHQAKVIFIYGEENPTPDWQYCTYHRQGVIVDTAKPGVKHNLDARDIVPPFTPGALRGGSHVHVWDADGECVSFTYEDHVLAQFTSPSPDHDLNLRNIAVSVPRHPVKVKHPHLRNHDGEYFTVLAARTVAEPKPGSDEIKKACEEGWIGSHGYVRADGTRQKRALAFQGQVVTQRGETISEVFVADLPEDLTQAGEGPLCGTEFRAPCPPKGTTQRRVTFTADRRFPGIQGPRHWLRSNPEGSRVAFLMKDDAGVVQIWTVSPNGGAPVQVTHNAWSVASAICWSPDGRCLTYAADNSVFVTEAASGQTTRVTRRSDDASAPRSEACVYSPNGKQIAFMRRVPSPVELSVQLYVVDAPK